VISDRKKRLAGTTPAFEAVIETAQDYYPFGSLMPGRKYNAGEYRFGFNGMEKDDCHNKKQKIESIPFFSSITKLKFNMMFQIKFPNFIRQLKHRRFAGINTLKNFNYDL
jgi:hypothetical protein